ncbi:MAG TPA: UDP-N-acetylmuramoyl-tripeptide--D-alanyl-D-alanine ligase [Polyangiales bacterium]|nr:UDP-N-acetylmuramoyl-tripeptide--D-alanyl-D-alanine ligase [Polyangiales bacterium]
MATPIPSNQASFTLSELAAACGGQLQLGAETLRVTGVTSDSRRVQAGELYVALRGEHHDGHAFLSAAQRAGAAAALVSDTSQLPAGLPAVLVADTRRALGDLARAHRRRWGKPVVAITGSAGKTTTKELTAAALGGTGRRVLKTFGNLNNDVGLPMTLFGLSDAHDVAVVEIGTSGPGEIERLREICEPNVGVVTTVALAHVEKLASLDAVADEKCALLRGLPADGTAIYGHESAELEARRATFAGARVMSFGEGEGASVRLVARTAREDMTSHCAVVFQQPALRIEFELKLFGAAPAQDAAAALAVIAALGDPAALQPAAAALGSVEPLPGRLRPCKGRAGSLIIDDSYNANPASMLSSLAAVREIAALRKGRAIAALGDMAELGEHAQAEHERLGRALVQAGLADVFLCGPLMADAARAAKGEVKRLRAKGPHVVHCSDPTASVPELMRLLSQRDAVLIKGSRSMAMERVVEALCLDKGERA